MTDDDLEQIEQWYRDPVRILPRKIVSDVAALVAEVRRLRARSGLIDAGLVAQVAKTPAGAGAIVGAMIGGLLGASAMVNKPLPRDEEGCTCKSTTPGYHGVLCALAGRAKVDTSPLRGPGSNRGWNAIADKVDGLCAAEFIRSPDYRGSPTDTVTDADIRCTRPKGHDGLHRHEPWAKDFR